MRRFLAGLGALLLTCNAGLAGEGLTYQGAALNVPNGAVPTTGNYSLDDKYLDALRNCLADVYNQVADCNIGVAGDSEGEAYGSEGGTSSRKAHGWPTYFRDLLRAAGFPAENNSIWGTHRIYIPGSFVYDANYDPCLPGASVPAGWSEFSSSGNMTTVGNYAWQSTGASGDLPITCAEPSDTVDVYYYKNAAFSTATIGDGTHSVPLTESGASNTLGHVTVGPAQLTVLGIHDGVAHDGTTVPYWRIHSNNDGNGNLYIVGIWPHDSTVKAVHIFDWSGGQASASGQWDVAPTCCNPLYVMQQVAPNHVFIQLGINDMAGGTLANFPTALHTIITTAKASASVSAISPIPVATGSIAQATQDTYNAAQRAQMAADNVPILDLIHVLPSNATGQTEGLYNADGSHTLAKGARRIALALSAILPQTGPAYIALTSGHVLTGNASGYGADQSVLRVGGAGLAAGAGITTGNAMLGQWSVSNVFAIFGNTSVDQTVAGNYAVLQQSNGATFVNASTGQVVSLCINNSCKVTMSAAGLTSTVALTYGGVTLSNAVTGTGNMVLSAAPVLTGTAGFASLKASGTFMLGSSTVLTLASGEMGLQKIAASGSAPGAAGMKIGAVCGTNAGSAKIIAYAGTSTTPVTVIDNIGAGVTGC